MSNKVTRGSTLSAKKVQEYAAAANIYRRIDLEREYDTQFEGTDVYANGAPKKAWEGKVKIQNNFAQQIAQILRLPDFLMLLEDQGKSAWEEIITSKIDQDDFLQFTLESEGGSGLFDLPFIEPPTPNKNDQINIKEQFFLKLKGKPGHHFMAILQSGRENAQLAPLSHEGFDNAIHLDQSELRYPSKLSIPFSKEFGLGWRRLTVIRSVHMPINPKSYEAGSPFISSEHLDAFASRILKQKGGFQVQKYLFNLVETKTIRFKS